MCACQEFLGLQLHCAAEYWSNVSEVAKSFVTDCLTIDPRNRPTAKEALNHKWLASEQPHFVADTMGEPKDLLPGIQKGFNARKTCKCHLLLTLDVPALSAAPGLISCDTYNTDYAMSFSSVRKAVLGMMAMKRMSMLSHQQLSPRAQELASEVKRYMEDSEKVRSPIFLAVKSRIDVIGHCLSSNVCRRSSMPTCPSSTISTREARIAMRTWIRRRRRTT